MKKRYSFITLVMLALTSCTGDEITITDDLIDSGSGTDSSTGLVDPELSWSASSYTANLEDGSWSFPTLTSSVDGLTITYSSSKAGVATVNSSTGVPVPVAAGSTVITATSESTDQYKSASATYTLVVSSNADDGSVTTTFPSAGDSSSEDDISNTTFSRLVNRL
mgnify:FL=1